MNSDEYWAVNTHMDHEYAYFLNKADIYKLCRIL